LYEDVISKEANEIRKNLEKLINDNYKFIKEYQLKLKRGFMIIKTLKALKSTTKIKIRDERQLQIKLKENNYLPISSPRKNPHNHCNYNYPKQQNNHNNEKNICNEYINIQNNVSYLEQSNLWTQKFYSKETNFVDISTSRNLFLIKKLNIINKNKNKNKNKYVRSDNRDIGILDNDLLNKKYVIVNPEYFQYLRRENQFYKANNFIKYFYLRDRKFIFPGKFFNISCFELYIIKNEQIALPKYFKRVYIKIFLTFMIYFIILFYLMILIQNIQTKYGDNFIQLCILPFVTTLLMKYLFTFNIMMLITSLILYNFGEYILNNKKVPLFIYGVSKLFISPVVLNHYYAIKLYQLLK